MVFFLFLSFVFFVCLFFSFLCCYFPDTFFPSFIFFLSSLYIPLSLFFEVYITSICKLFVIEFYNVHYHESIRSYLCVNICILKYRGIEMNSKLPSCPMQCNEMFFLFSNSAKNSFETFTTLSIYIVIPHQVIVQSYIFVNRRTYSN